LSKGPRILSSSKGLSLSKGPRILSSSKGAIAHRDQPFDRLRANGSAWITHRTLATPRSG
jgi:hypothetical protein